MIDRRVLWLIMRREIRARLFSKAFAVAQVVAVVLIVAVSALSTIVGGEDDVVRIGVVGDQPEGAAESLVALGQAVETTVEIEPVPGRDEAERLLTDGDLDGVVLEDRSLLVAERSNRVVALVSPAWQQAGLVEELQDAGLDAAQVVQALERAAPIAVVELAAEPEAEGREAVAFATVILMFVAIQVAGAYIILAVFEEKSTKVVELVLSSVPARYLLAGKILGIALIGILQVIVLALAALVSGAVFASSALPSIEPGFVTVVLVWFVLGYLLYGAVYAAGASLAPRQEDAQATLAPVSLVQMLSYFVVIVIASEPSSRPARVVSWVPVTSPFAMPSRMAAGAAPWWEIVGSMALCGLAVLAVMMLAERIYVRSVIHTDRKLGWREAWSLDP